MKIKFFAILHDKFILIGLLFFVQPTMAINDPIKKCGP